jgi:hypothetical protein
VEQGTVINEDAKVCRLVFCKMKRQMHIIKKKRNKQYGQKAIYGPCEVGMKLGEVSRTGVRARRCRPVEAIDEWMSRICARGLSRLSDESTTTGAKPRKSLLGLEAGRLVIRDRHFLIPAQLAIHCLHSYGS